MPTNDWSWGSTARSSLRLAAAVLGAVFMMFVVMRLTDSPESLAVVDGAIFVVGLASLVVALRGRLVRSNRRDSRSSS